MRAQITLGVLATVAMIAGCSSEQTPSAAEPTASPGAAMTASQEAPRAPRVSAPIDIYAFIDKPCAVLTAAQVETFGASSQKGRSMNVGDRQAFGPTCTWTSRNSRLGITVGIIPTHNEGLNLAYRGQANAGFAYFEPTMVADHPAVFADAGDVRSQGGCVLYVGASDTQVFQVTWNDSVDGVASCDKAKRVAEEVIKTAKGGA